MGKIFGMTDMQLVLYATACLAQILITLTGMQCCERIDKSTFPLKVKTVDHLTVIGIYVLLSYLICRIAQYGAHLLDLIAMRNFTEMFFI